MKADKIRELSTEELRKKEHDLKDELFKLRFQAATGHLENPMRIREIKRDIARVKTILRERELQARKQ
ncbi:MAG: large subunit ribosomal protein [Eubacteriales bacterium]|nr:large subunit ribosomal protein [Eubacteriales bacterium]MDN5363044.1 large subunit ribosomal protein [Eubacteriales bacterium]